MTGGNRVRAAALLDFIRANCTPASAILVPEISLHLAADPHGIFQACEERPASGERFPPFWAFAWPGGQALARHLLDNPQLVRGRRVLDIGAGSGLTAIAARMAGAADVLAADIDPLSEAAIRLNARANGVGLETTTADLLGAQPEADLILIGDLVYEPDLLARVTGYLEAARRSSVPVLLGDRTTARRPALDLALIAEHLAPVTPYLEEGHFERARVWRLDAAPTRRRGRR